MADIKYTSVPRMLALVLGSFLLGSNVAIATDEETAKTKLFDGFYGGAELGVQRVYSGALIDNVDVLQDDGRVAASLLVGWRHQFDNHLVVGLEGQIGLTDGDLVRTEPAHSLTINYNNGSHFAAGLTLGYAFGASRDWLFYGYGIASVRDFDLDISLGAASFTQEDRMGVIRYGVGIEKQWRNGWGVRAAIGSNYTDFGDLITNMDVNGRLEVSSAVIYNF